MAIPHGLPIPCYSHAAPHDTTSPQTPTTISNGFTVPTMRPTLPQPPTQALDILGHYHDVVNNLWKKHWELESVNVIHLHRQQLDRIMIQRNELEKKCKDQANSIDWHQSEHKRLKDQFSNEQSQLVSKHEEWQRASNAEVQRLQNQVSIQDEQIQNLDVTNGDVEARLQVMQNERDDAEKKYTNEQEVVYNLRKKLFEANTEKEDVQEENSTLTADLAVERSANADLQANMDVAEVAMCEALAERDKTLQALEAEQEAMKKLREQLRSQTEAADQMKQLNQRVEDCKKDKSSLQQHYDKLARLLKAAEEKLTNLHTELQSHKDQKATAEAQLTTASNDLTACEKKKEGLLSSIIEHKLDLFAEQDKNKPLCSDLDKLRAQDADRQSELTASKDSLMEMEVQMEHLRAKNAESSKTLDGMRACLFGSTALVPPKPENVTTAAKREDSEDTKASRSPEKVCPASPSSLPSPDDEIVVARPSAVRNHVAPRPEQFSNDGHTNATAKGSTACTTQPAAEKEVVGSARPNTKESTPSRTKATLNSPERSAGSPLPRVFLPFTQTKASKGTTPQPSALPKKLPSFKKKTNTSSTTPNDSLIESSSSATKKRQSSDEVGHAERRTNKRQAVQNGKKSHPQQPGRKASYYHPGVWR